MQFCETICLYNISACFDLGVDTQISPKKKSPEERSQRKSTAMVGHKFITIQTKEDQLFSPLDKATMNKRTRRRNTQ